MLAWIFALCSSLNWRPSELIYLKFPELCLYCDRTPCECDPAAPRRSPDVNRAILEKVQQRDLSGCRPAGTLADYQKMFDMIYGQANRTAGMQAVSLHFCAELNEVVDALLQLGSLELQRQVGILSLELADLLAWYFAILNVYRPGYDIEHAFSAMFPGRYYKCDKEQCECPEIANELWLASWRPFG